MVRRWVEIGRLGGLFRGSEGWKLGGGGGRMYEAGRGDWVEGVGVLVLASFLSVR